MPDARRAPSPIRRALAPWRALRRRLAEIRYHSAQRGGSRWRRAIDVAFLATLPLALAAVLLSELVVVRSARTVGRRGFVTELPGGRLDVELGEDDARGRFAGGSPWGDLELDVVAEWRGWPLATRRMGERIRIDLNRYDVAEIELDVTVPSETELARALDRALARDASDAAAAIRALWSEREVAAVREARRRIPATLAGTGLWWVGLFVAAATAIRLLQGLATLHAARRRKARLELLDRNRCPACGYELRGLEFRERCPECGALIGLE